MSVKTLIKPIANFSIKQGLCSKSTQITPRAFEREKLPQIENYSIQINDINEKQVSESRIEPLPSLVTEQSIYSESQQNTNRSNEIEEQNEEQNEEKENIKKSVIFSILNPAKKFNGLKQPFMSPLKNKNIKSKVKPQTFTQEQIKDIMNKSQEPQNYKQDTVESQFNSPINTMLPQNVSKAKFKFQKAKQGLQAMQKIQGSNQSKKKNFLGSQLANVIESNLKKQQNLK